MQTINLLKQLGFPERKAKVYLAILELGGGTVIDIAKKADLKRTTVYNLLPELIKEGLTTKVKRNKKTSYLAEDPGNIKNPLQEKIEAAEEVIPKLSTIYNVIPFKPKITFYEGLAGVKKFYDNIHNSLGPGGTILGYTGIAGISHYLPAHLLDKLINDRVKKKIRIKLIMPESEEAKKMQSEATQYLREVKIVSCGQYDFSGDVEIFGNKVAIIAYREDFMGIIIESKDIANMQRMAFELMWKGASQPNVL